MSYRPITDTWILARPRVKYYGAYPSGFLERARALLGVRRDQPVLHVCAGRAVEYPNWARLCPHDVTLDADPVTFPHITHDVRLSLAAFGQWDAILCDPPYTLEDADHYGPGREAFPTAQALLRNALDAVKVGGRVGMLHYLWPRPPSVGVKSIALCTVIVGYGNRGRLYSVFERLA